MGQTIVLDPDDGLLAVDSDRMKAVLAALRGPRARLRAGDDLLRRRGRPGRGRGRGRPDRGVASGRGGGGDPRRAAPLPVPHRGRVARWRRGGRAVRRRAPVLPKARRGRAVPSVPTRRSERAASPGATVLRRVGPRLGIRTVRDLLFHLPRRYDDLRALSTARELAWVPDGEPASARLQVRGIRVGADLPPPRPEDHRLPGRRHGRGRGDVVRPALHRPPAARGPVDRDQRQGPAPRLHDDASTTPSSSPTTARRCCTRAGSCPSTG